MYLHVQPLDMAWFHVWRQIFESMLSEELVYHEVGYKTAIALAFKAWRRMFPLDSSGAVIPNVGITKAFVDAGIMPFNPHAISDVVFKPAEAAGKLFEAAKAKAHAPDITPAAAQALVDKILPLAPAIPVDVAKAAHIARMHRGEVSELLTAHEYHARAAAAIIEEEAAAAEKQRKREERAAVRAAKAAHGEARAAARSAAVAARASAAPQKKRTRKPVEAPAVDAVATSVAQAPLAGQKRSADDQERGVCGTGGDGKRVRRIPTRLAEHD